MVNADGVPWCDTCDRFYNPNTLAADGTCSTCGQFVAEPPSSIEDSAARAPWHFKALIGVTAVYLAYRLLQGVVWVAQQL